MDDVELQRVVKFYSLMPENLLNQFLIENFNRQEKREIEKSKDTLEKLKRVLNKEILKFRFITNINIFHNFDEKSFEYKRTENIRTKKDYNIGLAIINKCLIDKQYNKLYFKKFISSEEYLKLVAERDTDIPEFDYEMTPKNKIPIKYVSKVPFSVDTNIKNIPSLEKEFVSMSKYICEIKYEEGKYYNIYPKYKLEDKTIQKVSEDDFPEYGNILIYPYNSFAEKSIYYKEDQNIWVIIIDEKNLQDNKRPSDDNFFATHKKIKDKILIEEEKIYALEKEYIFEIVEPLEPIMDIEQVNLEKLQIRTPKIESAKLIYLKINNFLYGPFDVFTKEYISYVSCEGTDYIVKKYDLHKIESYSINLQLKDRTFVDLISINQCNEFGDYFDCITDNKLLYKFEEHIKIPINLKKEICAENINVLIDGINSSKFISSSRITNYSGLQHISQFRMDRIKEMILNFVKKEENIIELSKIMTNLMLEKKNENFDAFIQSILENNEFTRRIQNIDFVKKKEKEFSEKIIQQQNDLAELKKEIAEHQIQKNELLENKQNLRDTQSDYFDNELIKKRDELNKLHDDYSEYSKQYETLRDLDRQIAVCKDRLNTLKTQTSTLKDQFNECNNELDLTAKKVAQQIPDIVFNGMLSSKLLKAASDWNNKAENDIYIKSARHSCSFPCDSFSDNELMEHLYTSITQKRRSYGKNDVINFMICITQGFLTIFSGAPGVGKTSICNIIGDTLGLTFIKDKGASINVPTENRYIDISVERGWTSKYDLIGYYNPLTKTFDKHNSRLYSAFNLLDAEGMDSSLPFLVMLDEANLSPMEYYWSDFIKICDSDLDTSKRIISLGENFNYFIPKTLKFLATINNDHTTEPLSPRVIDRAWIITLPDTYNYEEFAEQISPKIISWDCLAETFDIFNMNATEEQKIFNEFADELNEIYKMFEAEKIRISISARIKKSIRRYLVTGYNLFEPENERSNPKFIALDYVVCQKLLPKIDGDGEAYKSFLIKLQKFCGDNNMIISAAKINEILQKDKNNMNYYNFFV